MTVYGLFVDGKRPKSKKAVKEAIADNPARVSIENTSFLTQNPYGGTAADLSEGHVVTFVGPDPYSDRRFFGNITRITADKWKVE